MTFPLPADGLNKALQPDKESLAFCDPGGISLKEALHLAKLGSWEWDVASDTVTWSEEIYRLVGRDPALPAPTFEEQRQLFAPESWARLHQAVRYAIERLEPYELDLEFRLPNETTRWAVARGVVEATSNGRATRLCGTFQDITERKLAEQKLGQKEALIQQSEQQFQELADSLPQFIWVTDRSGTMIYCNRRYFDYAGTGSIEAMDRSWIDQIHPEDREQTVALWKSAIDAAIPYLAEYRLRSHDGSYRRFLSRAIPMRGQEGEIERWLGSSTDIHDQKLEEEALRQSEKIAVAVRLASTISHEINNPLESVSNLLYLLGLNASLDPLARDYLAMAEEELSRITHVTTQALRFQHQSTGATPVNISELVDSVLALHRQQFRNRGIEVRRRYAKVEALHCFAADIRHALSNIVGNAIDASPSQGIVAVRVHPCSVVDPTVPGVRITIADNGPGIPPQILPRIFEPFFSTKEVHGTGLGLWTAKNIIESHHGWVSVRTSTGKLATGTIFSVFLPCRQADAESIRDLSESGLRGQGSRAAGP